MVQKSACTCRNSKSQIVPLKLHEEIIENYTLTYIHTKTNTHVYVRMYVCICIYNYPNRNFCSNRVLLEKAQITLSKKLHRIIVI